MKKATKVSLVAALAVSALTPAMAIGAETNHAAPGFYNVDNGKVVTADAFVLLSNTEKTNLLKNSNVYYADGAGKVVQATKILTASTDAELVAALFPETELEADKNVTLTPEGTVVPGETAELKVESVKAINAKTIEVKFNQEMDKGTAEAAITVVKAGDNTPLTVTNTLLADKKTVRVVTTSALANNTGYDVRVAATAKTASGEALAQAYVKTFQFNDTSAPTVSKMETLQNGDFKITFSEELSATAGKVTINGFAYTPTPTATEKTVTIAKNDLVDPAKAGLEKGKSYSVIVEGFKDVAATPNVMQLSTSTLNYNYTVDTVSPVVSSVIAKDEKTLTLTFSKELVVSSKDGSTDVHTDLGLAVTKGSAAVDVLSKATTKDGKVFTVELDSTTNKLFNESLTPKEAQANLKVTVEGYKDLALNVGAKTEQTVTVNKDKTAPAINKVAYDFTAKEFVFSTSKSLAADIATTDVKDILTVVDENGVLVDLSTATEQLAIAAGDEEFTISNAALVNGLGLAPGTYKFTFAEDAFTDESLNGGNGNAEFTTTVVVTDAAANTDKIKPLVSSVSATGDVITVTFSESVKGGDVTGSATNPTNYKLAGKALPTGTLITLNAARDEAKIKLPAESIAKSETVLFSVSNIQDLAENTIVANTQNTVAVTDTVKPVLQGVIYDATNENLVLTFSENVKNIEAAGADFTIKVNGTVATVAKDAALATDKANVVRLSSTTTNLASGTITVTTNDSSTGTDIEGNKLKNNVTVTLAR